MNTSREACRSNRCLNSQSCPDLSCPTHAYPDRPKPLHTNPMSTYQFTTELSRTIDIIAVFVFDPDKRELTVVEAYDSATLECIELQEHEMAKLQDQADEHFPPRSP